ncbi:MAG TPA: threonine synthase [Chitinophagaceae bacterium]|nr:threonine synthase [Chitinophagaceae bacterium]
MLYYSTNRASSPVDFRQATITGQPPDKGLYFPGNIPVLPHNFIADLRNHTKESVALEVIRPYVGSSIPEEVLNRIIEQTIGFDFPLKEIEPGIFVLELFHGPTLAFKDVGAKFMSGCLEYFVSSRNRKLVVLTATSGDTGGAVANGFYGAEGIEVVILYPSGKVSAVQEMQLTRLGKNVHALEIEGSFDHCQRMVKQAFADAELNMLVTLTSANSINVARWIPQQFYYFFALQQWPHQDVAPVISVPSGNFGNLCAGLLAHRSGLPVAHFIAACNANDAVPVYFQTGQYRAKPAVSTLSNAMDVGDPSNFVRLLELYGADLEVISSFISSYSISDEETRSTIGQVFQQTGYLSDPHGAVAYAALKKHQRPGIFLETAHPVKFNDDLPMPASLANLLQAEKQAIKMEADYEMLKGYLLTNQFLR